MSVALEQWVRRHLHDTVEESGEHTARVQLLAPDESVIDTWDAPFDHGEFLGQLRDITVQLERECPPKGVQFVLTALDARGAERAQFRITLKGTNKGATLGLVGGERALSDAMQALATTMKTLLQSANVQSEQQAKLILAMSEREALNLELVRELREHMALTATEQDDALRDMTREAVQQIPALLALLAAEPSERKRLIAQMFAAMARSNGAAHAG